MPVITNKFVNSQFAGAVVGVIGAGGVMPTGWYHPTTGGGVTYTWEVTSLTTVAGQYIIGVKITCANASGADAYPKLLMGDIASVASSTLHQISLYTRRVSLTGSTYFEWLGDDQYTSGYAYLTSNTGLYNLTTSFARGANSFTTAGTTGIVIPYIGWGVPTGTTLTTEIEISQPMFVQAASLGARYYVPTTSTTPVTYSFLQATVPPAQRALPHLLR